MNLLSPVIFKLGFVLLDAAIPNAGSQQSNQFVLYDLLKNVGSIAAIITLVVIIYKLGVWVQKHVGRIQHLEDDSTSHVKPAIEKIDKKIEDRVLPVINEIHTGISYLKGAMGKSEVTVTKSPIVLNEKGNTIVTGSGIDKIIELQYANILSKVKSKTPANAYQAQEIIKTVVIELVNDPILKNSLEIGAFKTGADIDTVLFVGAIWIRDRILKELTLLPSDIDTYDPNAAKK